MTWLARTARKEALRTILGLASLIVAPHPVAAQPPAPGGISAGLEYWIRPEEMQVTAGRVSNWDDVYGMHTNEELVPQGFAYVPIGFNFHPTASTTRDAWIRFSNQQLLAGATAGEIFHLVQTTPPPGTGVGFPSEFGGGTLPGWRYDFSVTPSILTGWGTTVRKQWEPRAAPVGPNREVTEPHVFNILSKAGEYTARFDGLTNFTTATNTVEFNQSPSTHTYIGASHNSPFWGRISEVIVYRRELTAAERSLVQSYVATKYGITLGTTTTPLNYVASDGATIFWTGSPTFQNDVAGIGRDDASGLMQRQSRSVNLANSGNLVTMGLSTIAVDNASNPNNFATDRNFLAWGDDSASTAFTILITPPAGLGGTSRMARTWHVQETGTVPTVKVAVPSGLGGPGGTVYLIVSSDPTFDATDTWQPMTAFSAGTTNYLASDFNFTTGEYFTFAFVPTADLQITKTSTPTPFVPGQTLTYIITVSNAGPAAVTGATVTDTLPAPLAGFTWTCTGSGGGTCSASGSGSINTSVGLPVGGTATFTLTGTVPSSTTGVLSNTATVSVPGSLTDPNLANNTQTDTNTANPRADLSITKTSAPNPYTPGQPVTYTMVARNFGPSDAPGSVVQDTFPFAGFAWTCVGNGGGTCPASGSGNLNQTVNLPAGGMVTFTATGTVPLSSTTQIQNTATVTPAASVTDPVAGNNQATNSNPSSPTADLSITKVSSPKPYIPGQSVTYTIVVSNAGPTAASGALVQDTFPFAGFTWTCTASGGASCSANGSGNLNQAVNLPVGGSATFTATGTVPIAQTGQMANTATITAPPSVTDVTPGNNQATDNNPITATADLSITKVQTPEPYVPGQPVTYTIVVANGGPSTVTNARVQDTPDPSLTTVLWTCAPTGAGASCAAPSGTAAIDALVTLPSGTSATFTMTGNVPATRSGVLSNTATVQPPATVTDLNTSNNQATVNSGPAPQADLTLTKTVAPEPYRPGTAVTYTITVSNAGPSTVTGARVQDTFPAPMSGFTWTCAGAGGATCGTPNGSSVIDVLVNVPMGGTITFTASGVVPASTTTTETNTATVTPPTGTTDPNPSNNTQSAVSTPISSDVSITKADAADPVAAGDPIVYTLTVANAGPLPATSVSVSDPLPPGTTYVSASGSGWTCNLSAGTVACARPSLGVGSAPPITLTLLGPSQPGMVTNIATVTAAEVDPNAANNSATQTTAVAPKADLAITKVSTPNPYVAGQPFTYTIVASNLGPSDVTGADIADTLPPDLAGFTWSCTNMSSGASCGTPSGSGTNVSTTATLPAGGSITIVVTGTLPPSTSGALTNTATIAPPAGVPDPVSANNSATNTNPANNQADLRLTKTSTPNPFVPGDALTYTIVVSNAGPSNAPGARVRDTLPPGFASFTWTCAGSGGAICQTANGTGDIDVFVDLPAGGSATFTSTGTVPSSFAGAANNTATVDPPPTITDPVPGSNTSSTSNPSNLVADLTIAKTQTPDPYVPGAGVNYTLLVRNLGPSDVANARVQDVLPGEITGATWTCAASGTGAGCGSANGVNVVDALVTLPAGTSATFQIAGTVSPSATGVLTNAATVSAPADVTDPVPGNNESVVNSGAAPRANLTIVKTATPNPFVPGTPLTFTIVAGNAGPSDVSNARVLDLFPPALSGFTWTCAPSSGAGTCGTASGTGVIDVLVNLPAGSAVTFTATGTVPPDADEALANTATIAPPPGVVNPQPNNGSSTVTLGAAPRANLRATKTSTPNPYLPGAPITYTVIFTNDGPSDVVGAHVHEHVPPVLMNVAWTCVPTAGTCPAASGTGGFDALIDLAAGGSVTFTVTADVPSGTTGSLINAATIVPPPGIVDTNPTDNSGVDSNPVTPPGVAADLQITQEFPGVAPPNGLLTFRLVVRNLGAGVALNPYVTGMIPPGTTFVSSNPGAGGTCTVPGNPSAPDPVTGYPIAGAVVAPLKCTWPGLMKPDDTHVLEFTVRVAPATPTGQILWSCFWTWSETDDPYHANNVVDSYLFTHDGTSPVGDLSIQAAAMSLGVAGPDGRVTGADGTVGTEIAVPLNGTVKMRFWSVNNGPAATRGQYALILDNTAIEVLDVQLPQGWVSPSGPSSAVWDTGQVQPGQTVNVDLTLRVHTTGAIKLFAQRVTGTPGDPNASNERATIVLDGYGPNAAGRWVAVGNVDGASGGEIITGTGQGETPQVRVFTGAGADTGVRFFAYERPFLGGVRVASCDVNGDGVNEIITAPGPGRAPSIRVLSVVGGVVTELTAFDAFEPSFTGGAYVSCADLDADGKAEIVVGAGPGRAPEVQVYNAGVGSITLKTTFLAYEAGFSGGVRVAAGAYPGGAVVGAFGIATLPGAGRPAELRLWHASGAPVMQALISATTSGAVPVLGDANGDGRLDLLVTPDSGQPELVRIADLDAASLIASVPGGIPGFPVGIRVATGVLVNGGVSELVIGNAAGGDPGVRVISWPPSGPAQRVAIVALEIP